MHVSFLLFASQVMSTYSLDVDEVNQRTEERMRKLFRMNPDQVSMQDQDEVLDRFMQQRTHVTNEAERQPDRVILVFYFYILSLIILQFYLSDFYWLLATGTLLCGFEKLIIIFMNIEGTKIQSNCIR